VLVGRRLFSKLIAGPVILTAGTWTPRWTLSGRRGVVVFWRGPTLRVLKVLRWPVLRRTSLLWCFRIASGRLGGDRTLSTFDLLNGAGDADPPL